MKVNKVAKEGISTGMNNFEYISDGGKNYLKTGMKLGEDYISKMLIHNNIPGIVPAQFKSRDSENYIVYPVNGFMPLSQTFEIKRFSGERAESLIRSFVNACGGMEDFLLPFNRLVMEPEYIYEGYGVKEKFLWIYGNAGSASASTLFEYLLNRTDSKDERAIKIMYSMYQVCKEYEFMEAEDMGGSVTGMLYEKAKELISEPFDSFDERIKGLVENENAMFKKYSENNPLNFENIKDRASMKKEIQDKKIYENMGKDYISVREKSKEREREERGKMLQVSSRNDKVFVADSFKKVKNTFGRVWTYLNSDIGSKKRTEASVVEENVSEYMTKEVKRVSVAERSEESSKPTTLLTNGSVHGGVYCLRPEESGEDNVIITSYPFFIGKAERDVSLVLDDSTVSRYHARIDRTEDEFWITDLNSTNGTFLNGIRLLPYERVFLKRGDIVVISRKRYEFKYLD